MSGHTASRSPCLVDPVGNEVELYLDEAPGILWDGPLCGPVADQAIASAGLILQKQCQRDSIA